MRAKYTIAFALIFFCVFSGFGYIANSKPVTVQEEFLDRIVVPAPLQLALAGGDRFLAANLETFRLAATGTDRRGTDTHYLIRAQRQVSRLNACHEDNYYLANGLLTWGGAVEAGNEVLSAAVNCRDWDFLPPFFYGINLAFFQKDNEKAAQMLEVAAARSEDNRPSLLKTATVLRAETLANETLALNYLRHQRDSSNDLKLREMLNKRVVRLEGLLALRAAQKEFEAQFGDLAQLEQLLEKGFLTELPNDPLRLGYELKEGQIELKRLRIAGLEN